MGADYSKMGIVAMAIVSGIEREHLLKLRSLFQTFSQQNGEPNFIPRSDFDNSLKALESGGSGNTPSLEPPDLELLDRLFILFDESGECKIDYKDFLIGLSILISGTAAEKLLFAFTICDENNTGLILPSEMKKIFLSLNLVTSFFGDPVVSNGQVKEVVIDSFTAAQNPPQLPYTDHIDAIIAHPVVCQFLNGKGTVRFGR
jgi:Ca2+-binding EF-hand superfamily protein